MQAVAERMDFLGYNDEEIRIQVERLTSFHGNKREEVKRLRMEDMSFQEWVHLGEEEPTEEVETPGPSEEGVGAKEKVELDEIEISEDEEGSVVRVPMGHYVVSVVGRSKMRTLHRVGECFRKPGERYANYDYIGNEPPDASMFHRACRVCFPKGGISVNSDQVDSESGEDDVSSSDSSVAKGEDP